MKKLLFVLIPLIVALCVLGYTVLTRTNPSVADPLQESCEVSGGVLGTTGCVCSRLLPIFATSTQSCTDQFGTAPQTREEFSSLQNRTSFFRTCEQNDAEPYVVADIGLSFCAPYEWGGVRTDRVDDDAIVSFPSASVSPFILITKDISRALAQVDGLVTKGKVPSEKKMSIAKLATYLQVPRTSIQEVSAVEHSGIRVFRIALSNGDSVYLAPYMYEGWHGIVTGVTRDIDASVRNVVIGMWVDRFITK